MRNKVLLRLMAAFLAAALCVPAFSIPALAYGGGDNEDQTVEVTGGLEPEAEESASEDTDEAEGDASLTDGDIDALLTDGDIASLLSALSGFQVSVTEDGIQIDSGEDGTGKTGTVTTNGGNLNVRTGAGLDNTAFTQLPNGATVEVIGEDGDWIQILLPERVGYVHSDYLTVSDSGSETGAFSLSLGEDEIVSLLELFTGGAGAALTPDGNLTLLDDIGSTTASGKQFITVETKNGNVFYLIIDRDDEGEETVHFLNRVDEADLLALMDEEGTAEAAIVCTCTEKCAAGSVNTSCPVCASNMTECTGKEAVTVETEPIDEPEETSEETKGGMGALLAVLLLLGAGGGAAAYFLVLKPKQGKKVPSDLDDLDLEDEEEFLNEDEETEETE